MRRIVDAFGEYERLLIKARTRAALRAKKARGERIGQIPYGRRLTGSGPAAKKSGLPTGLGPDPVEAEALAAHRRIAGRQGRRCGRSPASSTGGGFLPSPDDPGSTARSTTS